MSALFGLMVWFLALFVVGAVAENWATALRLQNPQRERYQIVGLLAVTIPVLLAVFSLLWVATR